MKVFPGLICPSVGRKLALGRIQSQNVRELDLRNRRIVCINSHGGGIHGILNKHGPFSARVRRNAQKVYEVIQILMIVMQAPCISGCHCWLPLWDFVTHQAIASILQSWLVVSSKNRSKSFFPASYLWRKRSLIRCPAPVLCDKSWPMTLHLSFSSRWFVRPHGVMTKPSTKRV